jgi:tetratricopeptide (TPR) repeat protein
MKAMKYLLIGALMLGFGTQVKAQEPTGTKADVDAVKKIISSKPADLDKQMKPFYKANRKNAENLYAFGRAFYEAQDTANAHVYANYALEASKNKFAPAYVLLGDIAALGDDGGAAASQYDQAIYYDKKLVEAYRKYAMVYRKIDPAGAAAKLDELKANCPEVSVDAIKGHIFMVGGDEKAAYNEFKKVPIGQLDKDYLNEFARVSYFQGHYEDALAACQEGLKDKPRNATFTRLAMFSNYELKNYEAAKDYIYKYFNETDSAKFSEYDHYYSALIYDALGEKQNAYAEYDKALALVQDGSMIKRWTILKTLSDAYLKDKDFEKAIKYYQEFTASKPGLNFDDEESLATIYSKYAKEDASKKEELTNKAANIYGELATKYPNQVAYATYMRANLRNSLDNNMEKSLAKPDYQKLVDILGAKADRTKGENTMLKTAYHYLMFNAYINKDVAGAKAYADKILAIDPAYDAALKIKEL